jgi:hypothetical protein
MSVESGAATRGSDSGVTTIAREGGIALVLALVLNLVIVTLAGMAGIGEGIDPFTYPPVLVLTTVGVIGAVIVYAILASQTGNPNRNFTGIAAIALLVSVIPDFTFVPSLPGGSLVAGAVLALMHVLTAVVVVWRLTS